MSRYVDPTEQLVTEIVVRDIRRSTEFHRRSGFALLRDGGTALTKDTEVISREGLDSR